MTVYRAVVKDGAGWRHVVRPIGRQLSTGPLAQDCETRRYLSVAEMADRLGIPVGVIVEVRNEE